MERLRQYKVVKLMIGYHIWLCLKHTWLISWCCLFGFLLVYLEFYTILKRVVFSPLILEWCARLLAFFNVCGETGKTYMNAVYIKSFGS